LVGVLGAGAAVAACAAAGPADVEPGSELFQSDEDELIRKTLETSRWSYRGIMPRLETPEITVSLRGHTVHVAGFLPPGFTEKLPFHAKTENVAGRTRVHLAYPIATVDPTSKLESGLLARNPEPFTYAVCDGAYFAPSNSTGAFGGFPFIEYVCRHRDSDGRVRSGIAFHGPITATRAGGVSYWSLRRGPVSHACNRMLGEHVLEMAHVIRFDQGVRGVPVKVIADFDTFEGKILDVDYPSTNWVRPQASESTIFPIWQAVSQRPDGSIALDFPQWACETSRCPIMPPNARDPYTGARL